MLSPYIILVPNLILHIVQYVVTKRKSLKQFITLPILWSHGLASSSSTYHSPSVVYMLMRISDLLSIIPHFLCFVKGETRFARCQVQTYVVKCKLTLSSANLRCQVQTYVVKPKALPYQAEATATLYFTLGSSSSPIFFKFFLYIVLTIVLLMYYLLY